MTPSRPTSGRAPDMQVSFAGIQLKNPVIAASGTFGYGIEFEDIVHLDKLGGFVVKGLSKEPMEEMLHAMKIYEYIGRQTGTVRLAAIAEPPTDFGTPLEMFKKTLAHEQFITKSINDLMEIVRGRNVGRFHSLLVLQTDRPHPRPAAEASHFLRSVF